METHQQRETGENPDCRLRERGAAERSRAPAVTESRGPADEGSRGAAAADGAAVEQQQRIKAGGLHQHREAGELQQRRRAGGPHQHREEVDRSWGLASAERSRGPASMKGSRGAASADGSRGAQHQRRGAGEHSSLLLVASDLSPSNASAATSERRHSISNILYSTPVEMVLNWV